jgi:hypothetical protein
MRRSGMGVGSWYVGVVALTLVAKGKDRLIVRFDHVRDANIHLGAIWGNKFNYRPLTFRRYAGTSLCSETAFSIRSRSEVSLK